MRPRRFLEILLALLGFSSDGFKGLLLVSFPVLIALAAVVATRRAHINGLLSRKQVNTHENTWFSAVFHVFSMVFLHKSGD